MKNIFIILFLLVFSIFTFAQTPPKTVTDFYLRLPGDFFSTTLEGKSVKGNTALDKFRRSIIKTQDIRNGYLKLEGYSEGWGEVAIFKKRNGTYIVGAADSVCGPACEGTLKFLTYQNGKWTDVTEEV